MEGKGKVVRELSTFPVLFAFEHFYYELFLNTMGDIPSVIAICKGVHQMDQEELAEAIQIIAAVKRGTGNASNTT